MIDNNVLLKNWLVIKQKQKTIFSSSYCNYCRTTIIKIIMESPISPIMESPISPIMESLLSRGQGINAHG